MYMYNEIRDTRIWSACVEYLRAPHLITALGIGAEHSQLFEQIVILLGRARHYDDSLYTVLCQEWHHIAEKARTIEDALQVIK